PRMPPAPPDPLPVELVQQVNALVARFEAERAAGVAPAIEDLLATAPAVARPELLRQLLLVECERRQHAGQPLTAAEAQRRFAGLGPWVAGVLAALGLEESADFLTLEVVAG